MPRLTPGYGIAFGGSVARTGTRGSVAYVQMDQQMIADYTPTANRRFWTPLLLCSVPRRSCDEWEPIDSDVCGSNQNARER